MSEQVATGEVAPSIPPAITRRVPPGISITGSDAAGW